MRKRCIFNWSGGKDSSLALHYCLQNPDLQIEYLVTNLNDSANRISMHGVREELLLEQARSLGIPLYQVRLPDMPGMKEYDAEMSRHLAHFKSIGITHSIFGDIFLEDLRQYREDRLQEVGLEGIFPLWGRDTAALINEFLDKGFRTVISCTQARLADFCGKEITHELIKTLPDDIDVCGENGEFHTFVFEGPIFSYPINYACGEKIFRALKAPASLDSDDHPHRVNPAAGFWYTDLLPA